MKRLAVLVCLLLTACPIPFWPDIPEGCRNFKMTTWGSNAAPWNEIDWNQIYIIDEPMLDIWGWPGDLNNPTDVCGPIGLGMVQGKIDAGHALGKTVWLNWSSEEFDAVYKFCGNNIGLNADVISFDSYGGSWDFHWKTEGMLNLLHQNLAPGQLMGVVPEGHYAPDWGVRESTDELRLVNSLYFNWAMREANDGSLYAFAPFQWGPCASTTSPDLCIADQPALVQLLTMLANGHPVCTP
jgi:hypothetical protein